jgi:hypothetical protein
MDGATQTTITNFRVNALLQESIDRIIEEIARRGFNLAVDDDMHGLQQYLSNSGAYPNPSFDPNVHDLTSNAFWLRVEDKNGRVIASHAERIYKCQDFVEEIIESDRIWFETGVPQAKETWRTDLTRPATIIAGSIGYAGAMFVQPDHRGSGLALFLPYLSRSLCLRNYKTDWHTGLIHLNIANSPIPTSYYGYPRTAHIFSGTCPRTSGGFKDVHLCWMDRGESIEKLCALPNHPRYPVALPLLESVM